MTGIFVVMNKSYGREYTGRMALVEQAKTVGAAIVERSREGNPGTPNPVVVRCVAAEVKARQEHADALILPYQQEMISRCVTSVGL